MRLNFQEAENLFDAIHYYGNWQTLELIEEVISGEDEQLVNHWDSFDEFLAVWEVFYKLSRELSRTAFGKVVSRTELPTRFELSPEQQAIFSKSEEFAKHACYLLGFFDSLSDHFDFEIRMMEKGFLPYRRIA